ncbi:relaxase/mobilization nuclease RlxS [Sphingomonas sp. PR090111-T3T-6A]|uniref:relaxase/mobilization nuclease RlxS n=1 Tax=Sphingomonas sp. PR090111-T3T-6A TaxID=685778 RepID=UPI00037BE4B6|nr:relaxase/mobilization nuclease RlxS [Sphingomonas sp. PR090111-T3T-6A]
MADDDFELWLGRSLPDRSVVGSLRRSTNLAGGRTRTIVRSRRFTGEQIGRGGSIARLLSTSDHYTGPRARRVVVKTRYVKMAGKGARRAAAHLRYLQRDGTTRDGERGTLYGADRDVAEGKVFHERCTGDRHQFRFIVAAEDGAEYEDLKPLVRKLMTQAEQDLGTRLEWVAVDHFNTGHPHSHILLRGKDDKGGDLIIGREYLTVGLRVRATDIVNFDLGPRSEMEMARAQAREIEAERFTQIDRRLVQAVDISGLVSPTDPNGMEQAARAGRLQALGRMGLAKEERRGHWRLDAELETTLRAMGRRGDIIATLNAALARDRTDISPSDYAIYEPRHAATAELVGRVITTGLSDEQDDRRYSVIEATDGRAWHVDLGELDQAPALGTIVRVAPTPVVVRNADRTVAEIAAANGGLYDVDIHLRHDRSASEDFATAHVRRLEALRRAGADVTRLLDGRWEIDADHVEQVREHEQRRAERKPVIIDTLATQPLDRLTLHDGVTWLDREMVADKPARLERGFGEEVRRAQNLRRQWLVEQGLIAADADRLPGDMLDRLQRRELVRLGAQLSQALGLEFGETQNGERIEGRLERIMPVGDSKFALVERSHDFVLVPWRPSLEKQIGKQVSGIARADGSASWTIGRDRGPSIG